MDIEDVRGAAARISAYIHRTPVMQSELLNLLTGTRIFFKCENLQKAGAFKARGAMNAVLSLTDAEAGHGVATHSSGNHGAALARAAKIRGIPAYIVVPEGARAVKQAAIRQYGGTIIDCAPTLAAREATLADIVDRTGAHFVPPYDDDRVIAGQGTAMLELIEQVAGLDTVIAPVGGGGLLAGCAVVAREHKISVFGAEPEGADDAYRSFKSGVRVTSHVPKTIADGLQTTLGSRNFDIIRLHVDDILLVPDSETIDAMRLLWTRTKLIVEPSAAVTLAAILRYPAQFVGKRVGVILSGGNVDPGDLPF